ncbi:MBL fold metallo-hydrolase [bacterium]|nr:MBL fold metallo-hydrolase [bacterium]
MRFDLGPLRLDVIDDGLFELRPETFVKVNQGRHASLLDKTRFRPRIKVGFNSLLIRGEGKTILIDPGTGDKERTAQVREYKMEWPRKVLPALRELGVQREQVDLVILTHLHWDHCGACTTIGAGGQIEPTFPRARYIVQKRELDGARRAIQTDDDGYLSDDYEPLFDARKIDLIEADDAHVLPWLSVHWTGGHSAGHQVVRIGTGATGHVMYFSDLIPTTAQLQVGSGMSYDETPNELSESKRKFMRLCAREGDLAVLVHAPRNRLGHLIEMAPDDYRFKAI